MTTIALKNFSGEIPNLPPYLLPDTNAQQAIYCDFAQKDLRPLKNGTQIATMSNNIKGIYTEDGINFLTWPIETYAYKSPVIGDTFSRVYFMNASGYYVTTVNQADNNGGEPANSWLVGVPTPATPPTASTVELTTLRGYPSATVTVRAWYEAGGSRYDETQVTAATVTAFKKYTFTPPTRSGNTPASATLYASFTITDSGKQVLSVSIPAGTINSVRSQALPGGIEFTLTAAGEITLQWGVYETRAYVFTVTNTFNEESAPSPAAVIDVTYMQKVTLGATLPSFTGYRPMQGVSFYRTFGTSAAYSKINVTDLGSNSYSDESYQASDIKGTLLSADWEPPVTGMFGLTLLPNGVFAAFKGNVLYMSEPYRPHSWPYKMSFPQAVRGICPGAQSLVVTTAEGCYNVLGNSPKNMAQQRLPLPQAGVTHRSMALIDGAVGFASNDGIVVVNGSQATMELSQKFFSRDDWRGRYANVLDTLRFAYHDGFLVGTSPAGVGFLVRLDEAAGTFTQFSEQIDAAFYLPVLDTLYYAKGATLYRFRTGTNYTFDWWSKEFILPSYVALGAGYIRCTGPVTLTLYAEGAQWHQVTLSNSGYFRLPSGIRARRWSIRLQSSASLQELYLATAMGELGSV